MMIVRSLPNDSMHGFIKKLEILLHQFFVNSWELDFCCAVDQGYRVDIAYLNFSKAFDSVPHQRLRFSGRAIMGFVVNGWFGLRAFAD